MNAGPLPALEPGDLVAVVMDADGDEVARYLVTPSPAMSMEDVVGEVLKRAIDDESINPAEGCATVGIRQADPVEDARLYGQWRGTLH